MVDIIDRNVEGIGSEPAVVMPGTWIDKALPLNDFENAVSDGLPIRLKGVRIYSVLIRDLIPAISGICRAGLDNKRELVAAIEFILAL